MEKSYQNRSHKEYDCTTDDQDKDKSPETASDKEGEEFARTLLVAMQYISREIKEMRMGRMRESPGRFHPGESSDMYHNWTGQPVSQPQAPQAPQCSTMPTFLAMENEGKQEKASLKDYFVEYESQNQRFRDHLSFQ